MILCGSSTLTWVLTCINYMGLFWSYPLPRGWCFSGDVVSCTVQHRKGARVVNRSFSHHSLLKADYARAIRPCTNSGPGTVCLAGTSLLSFPVCTSAMRTLTARYNQHWLVSKLGDRSAKVPISMRTCVWNPNNSIKGMCVCVVKGDEWLKSQDLAWFWLSLAQWCARGVPALRIWREEAPWGLGVSWSA